MRAFRRGQSKRRYSQTRGRKTQARAGKSSGASGLGHRTHRPSRGNARPWRFTG